MLQAALASELLTGDNQYQCDTCEGLRDATKALRLVAAPRVLVLVLLRFKYDGETQSRRKLGRVVEYPEALAVEVESGEVAYTLQSLVVHSGTESGEGHYYSLARRLGTARRWVYWLCQLVDPCVTEVSRARGGRCSATPW